VAGTIMAADVALGATPSKSGVKRETKCAPVDTLRFFFVEIFKSKSRFSIEFHQKNLGVIRETNSDPNVGCIIPEASDIYIKRCVPTQEK
jgi:hypothetical protein